MKQKAGVIILILTTICVLLLNISNLLEYINTGVEFTPFSTVCFIAGDICIVIGWILYFFEKARKKK